MNSKVAALNSVLVGKQGTIWIKVLKYVANILIRAKALLLTLYHHFCSSHCLFLHWIWLGCFFFFFGLCHILLPHNLLRNWSMFIWIWSSYLLLPQWLTEWLILWLADSWSPARPCPVRTPEPRLSSSELMSMQKTSPMTSNF